jgi:hypothetical protein
MPIAQGACPNCGAPTEFTAGASVSKVCPYCRHLILRTDRDFQNLGRAADLADTPSRVAVGDRGTIRGRSFEVLGRVQLDYGSGPWDEFYARFGDGAWGWLAEAQGNFYVTQGWTGEGITIPPASALVLEATLELGRYGAFKVVERRDARVLSAEGELPMRLPSARSYADLHGPNDGFATVDYGDGTAPPELFIGAQVPLADVKIAPRGGEKPGAKKVALEAIQCPNCGAALPPPATSSIERIACRYCHALSDLASLTVIQKQDAARRALKVPLGSRGDLDGAHYVVIGYMRRSAEIENERFAWHEYLLYSDGLGFRWLVEDEGNWLFARQVSSADVDARNAPRSVKWHTRTFEQRNRNAAKVEYVLGEFYWKVAIGDETETADYVAGNDVISYEADAGEVNWTYSTPIRFKRIATAFDLSAATVVANETDAEKGGSKSDGAPPGVLQRFATRVVQVVLSLLVWVVLLALVVGVMYVGAVLDEAGGSSSSSGCSGGSSSGGGGWGSSGGFGGK